MTAATQITEDTPLRLADAAARAFPGGGMTASGLRKEAGRGRLVIERIAGKDYTTLRAISQMRELMPRRAKGPRLWLQPARRDSTGKLLEAAVWCVRDGAVKRSTGVGPGEGSGPPQAAQDALRDYLNSKAAPRISDRDPSQVEVATVVAIYCEDVAPNHARPENTADRLTKVLEFFGTKTLDYLNKKARRRRPGPTALRLRGGMIETVELDEAGNVIEPLRCSCGGFVVIHRPRCPFYFCTT